MEFNLNIFLFLFWVRNFHFGFNKHNLHWLIYLAVSNEQKIISNLHDVLFTIKKKKNYEEAIKINLPNRMEKIDVLNRLRISKWIAFSLQ